MATNKRKDAAALFELIDRSTLKVPKNAGALKIPSWWSSKTNPAPNTTEPATGASPPSAPTTSAASAKSTTSTGSGATSSAAARVSTPGKRPDAGAEAEKPQRPSAQSRLFSPPAGGGEAGTSPSIRPPSSKAAVPVVPAVRTPAAAAASAAEGAEYKSTEPISESDLPPDVPPLTSADEVPAARPAKVFAPQTHSQDRKAWSPPRRGSFARLPAWVLICGMAGVVIVITIVVAIAKKTNSSAAPTAGQASVPRDTGMPATGRSLVPQATTGVFRGQGNENGNGAGQGQMTTGRGTVYGALTFPYDPAKFYIIVCSTPSQTIADRDAGWVADHGIDAAVEKIKSRSGVVIYGVIALRDFSSALAAEPFRQEIVKIGDSHKKDAWKTAYAANGLSPATSRPVSAGRGP